MSDGAGTFEATRDLRLQAEILSRIRDGLSLVRADDLVIVWTRRRFEEMFGYAPDELIGKPASSLNAAGGRDPTDMAREIAALLRGRDTGTATSKTCARTGRRSGATPE